MKKTFKNIPLKLALCAIIGVIFISGGCASQEVTPKEEGFAIYLTKNDIPPPGMPALSHVDIAEYPVISMDDIVSYSEKTHEISLTPESYQRISKLEVPVQGRSFVVCVNSSPIYWGAFWTPISSLSFDGVVIMKPLGAPLASSFSIEISIGYPSSQFYKGEDPRTSPEIMKALRQAGKLN